MTRLIRNTRLRSKTKFVCGLMTCLHIDLKGSITEETLSRFVYKLTRKSYELGLSARSVDLKWNPQRRMIIGELNRICSSISSVSLFLVINITQIEASVTLFAIVILISRFLENDMFSIEMDPWILLRLSKGLEKHWLLNFTKRIFSILFCDRLEYL